MKAVVIAVVVLAFVASALAACDASGLASCTSAYSTCVTTNAGDKDAYCGCFGSFIGCADGIGCDASVTDSYKTSCTAYGCTAAQCSSASALAATFGVLVAAALAF